MGRFSRRWFLGRLAAASAISWIGVERLTACGQHGVAWPEEPSVSTPTTTTGARSPSVPVEIEEFPLPQPRTQSTMSLEEALARRRSIRAYTSEPLSMDDIGQLFWSAQGVTRSWGGRTAPSAGALYPLQTYAATTEGLYQYVPTSHRARRMLSEDIRQALWAAGLRQGCLRQAPATFVITAVYERTSQRYGSRAERYVKMEVGHAAENLLLQAVALNLGAVVVGAFDDAAVAAALHLPAKEEPLYLIPVGHPAE